MKIKKIEGISYCAYGVDISESTNIELLEKIYQKEFEQMSQEELEEYHNVLKKEKIGDVLPWIFDKSAGYDEVLNQYFYGNKELNPYNLLIECWSNIIFYGPSYPWQEKDRDVTYAQVEETLNKIAEAFNVKGE